jgi:alpha-tubulin suppressor-like RCC1 family protein
MRGPLSFLKLRHLTRAAGVIVACIFLWYALAPAAPPEEEPVEIASPPAMEPVPEAVEEPEPPKENRPPTVNDVELAGPWYGPMSGLCVASDPDQDGLSYEVRDRPSHGRAWLADGRITYVPNRGFSGRDSFTYRASDGQAFSECATVTIEVKACAFTVWVWGSDSHGLFGKGTEETWRLTPTRVDRLGDDVVEVAIGCNHAAVLKGDGTVFTCGFNTYGELGKGTTKHAFTWELTEAATGVAHVETQIDTTYARKRDGTFVCWGKFWNHQTPEEHKWGPYGFAFPVQTGRYSVGDQQILTIDTAGRAWVWGALKPWKWPPVGGSEGKPWMVSGVEGVVAITTTSSHSLLLCGDGALWRWGSGFYGDLEFPTTGPERIEVPCRAVDVASGSEHHLVLADDGTVWAWGQNSNGQLGDGTTETRREPVRVEGLTDVVAISSISGSSLALTRDGVLWGWGGNSLGMLGDGTLTTRTVPTRVKLQGRIADFRACWNSSYALTIERDGEQSPDEADVF